MNFRDMTIGHRIALTVFIVLAILFALAALGFFTGRWEEDPPSLALQWGLASAESRPEVCVADEETRERLRGIMFEALDAALFEQFKKLMIVWFTDERGQPDRARIGVRQALQAHQHGRKFALEWTPPVCSG